MRYSLNFPYLLFDPFSSFSNKALVVLVSPEELLDLDLLPLRGDSLGDLPLGVLLRGGVGSLLLAGGAVVTVLLGS